MVRLTDRPDMTIAVYRGCKTTKLVGALVSRLIGKSADTSYFSKQVNRL